MNATTRTPDHRPNGAELPRDIGLHGSVAVAWAAAGGILLGGVLVALMTLSGRLSGHGLFLTASGLFVIGAVLGLVHGGALGLLGRRAEVATGRATADLAMAAVYAIPALAVGWLITVWVAMTTVALYLDRTLPLMGVGIGWAAAAAVVATAAVLGWRALRNAYARWEERQAGTLITAGTFAALLVTFLADRPTLWGLHLRVTETGAVLLAGALALWVAGPAVTLALRMRRDLPGRAPSAGFGTGRGAAGDLALGLLAGLVLGLLAVPFAVPGAAAATGAVGAVVGAVGHALVDEVLLRLVLMTGIVWVLLRWQRVHREEAVLTAVVVTALAQVLLYAPGVAAVGFPTLAAAAGFMAVTVLLPAVAFGVLYWARGLGTAVVAHATAVGALVLVAL